MLDPINYHKLVKAGVLIARKYPDRMEEVLKANSCMEIADILGFSNNETFQDTIDRLEKEQTG